MRSASILASSRSWGAGETPALRQRGFGVPIFLAVRIRILFVEVSCPDAGPSCWGPLDLAERRHLAGFLILRSVVLSILGSRRDAGSLGIPGGRLDSVTFVLVLRLPVFGVVVLGVIVPAVGFAGGPFFFSALRARGLGLEAQAGVVGQGLDPGHSNRG